MPRTRAASCSPRRSTRPVRRGSTAGSGSSARAYDDRSLSRLNYTTQDGELLADTLLHRYAVDKNWLLELTDQPVNKVRAALEDEIGRAGRSAQLVLAIFGHAYLGDDDRVYLAFRDFDLDDASGSGLPLDDLVRSAGGIARGEQTAAAGPGA
ncbi:MAG: hypothetical protein R3B90_06100 [Planctomycetaceae bacterium]